MQETIFFLLFIPVLCKGNQEIHKKKQTFFLN